MEGEREGRRERRRKKKETKRERDKERKRKREREKEREREERERKREREREKEREKKRERERERERERWTAVIHTVTMVTYPPVVCRDQSPLLLHQCTTHTHSDHSGRIYTALVVWIDAVCFEPSLPGLGAWFNGLLGPSAGVIEHTYSRVMVTTSLFGSDGLFNRLHGVATKQGGRIGRERTS